MHGACDTECAHSAFVQLVESLACRHAPAARAHVPRDHVALVVGAVEAQRLQLARLGRRRRRLAATWRRRSSAHARAPVAEERGERVPVRAQQLRVMRELLAARDVPL
jgi:hypothetical protein